MAQVIQATGKVAPVRAVLYLLRQRYPVRGRAGAASYGALPASVTRFGEGLGPRLMVRYPPALPGSGKGWGRVLWCATRQRRRRCPVVGCPRGLWYDGPFARKRQTRPV